MDLLDVILHPAIWWLALVVWIVIWLRDRQYPPVHPKFDKRTARPGELFADGSTATSFTEKKVRKAIEDAGYKLYPPSTRIYTLADANGVRHKYTPDILLKKPKMVVEVDPHFWHGDRDKIAHDIDRNVMYARLGYTIVRVRIGGTMALSPNDVVIADGDFNIEKHGPLLLKGIKRAKFYPPKVWSDPNRYIAQQQKVGPKDAERMGQAYQPAPFKPERQPRL